MDLLAVGRIAHAHGIKGEVSVEPFTEQPDRFTAGSTLHTEDGRTFTVESSRTHHKRTLIKLAEVPDRTTAETLRGTVLFVPAEEAPEPPEGAFWPHDLIGCEVVTEDGDTIGPVTEVLQNPANDLWVTARGMIPAVREIVLDVDLEARRITIRPIPGLLEEPT